MKKLLFLCFVLSYFSIFTQNTTLPIIKNGKWFLFKSGQEIALPQTYTFVNLLDDKGYASFTEGNFNGIIDSTGKEIVKTNTKTIDQIGNGLFKYSTSKGFEYESIDTKISIKCKSSNLLEKNWIQYTLDSSSFIFNLINQKSIKLNKSSSIYYHGFNYMLIKNDTLDFEIFGPAGELIEKSSAEIQINDYYLYFKGKEEQFICDRLGKWDFPQKAKNVSITEQEIQFNADSTCYIIDRNSKIKVISANADRIETFLDYYKIYKKGKVGLINSKGSTILPTIYSSIEKSEKYYHVSKASAEGILNLQFKELIPCKYGSIYQKGDFFYTTSGTGFYGLISALNYSEILTSSFNKFEINELTIKAWTNNQLLIVQLTENHEIKNKLYIDNVISINYKKTPVKPLNFDPRLFKIGWFYDTVSILSEKGEWKKTSYKWGLKNENDSILLKSSLTTPIFIEKAFFSKVNFGKIKSNFLSGIYYTSQKYDIESYSTYKIIDFTTGKYIKTPKIFDIDTTDFQRYSFARIIQENGYGIIFPDGTTKEMSYIEKDNSELIRYCNATNYKKIENINSNIEIVYLYPKLNNEIKNKNYYYYNRHSPVCFFEAKWNFINKEGDSIFNTPFDFAQNFHKKTAIVKIGKNWGVVNKDSLIIPAIYSSINRISQFSDTVFMVTLIPKGNEYLDSTLTKTTLTNCDYYKGNNEVSIFTSNDTYSIVNNKNQIKTENLSNVQLKEFNFITTKVKKNYLILNSEGEEVGHSISKPTQFISSTNFIFENNGKKGVLNLQSDTLLPCKYAEISKIGSRLIVINNEFNELLDSNFQLIKKSKTDVFLIDSVTNYWTASNSKSIQVYNNQNQKILKWHSEKQFIHFFNQFLFTKDGLIFNLNGEKINGVVKFKEVKFYDDKYCSLLDEDDKWHLYNENWTEKTIHDAKNKMIIYHGNHVFSMINTNGFMVYDYLHNKEYSDFTSFKGNFINSFILVEIENHFMYLNRNFENQFKTNFNSASEFTNGFACVSNGNGWTVIDQKGNQKSLSSYNEIKQVGCKLFQTTKKPLYGFIDSSGRILIEPIFEKLTILKNGVIQGIKEGEIRYFKYTGEIIY